MFKKPENNEIRLKKKMKAFVQKFESLRDHWKKLWLKNEKIKIFPKNWHFRPKLAFFLANTASKHLGETDQRKWLQKSWGLYEVTDKSYDQKTNNFHFGRNVDSSFTFNFFGDLLEPSTLLQSLFWSVLLRISCF